MLIHAYKRKVATPVDTGNAVIEFDVNADGDVVALVSNKSDIAVLLAIPEAFKAYKSEPAPADADVVVTSFVLKGATEAEDIDLAAMTEDELKAFAKANSVTVHHSWTGDKLDKLRQKLVDTFSAE